MVIMKVEQTSLFGISQGDGLPPLFFLLMSLGWLVTAIESHEEGILRPSGILMCESHCRFTVDCLRHVFNPENLSCSCEVSLSVAKETYCKSFKGCNKGAKLFSRRKGKLVCTLIRTKTKKIESGKPFPKPRHHSKRSSECRKTNLLLNDKTMKGYRLPSKPNSIIHIKSIGVMVLSKQGTFYHLKVVFKGPRLTEIKAYPACSLVRGKHWTNHNRWKSCTIAQDIQQSTKCELIYFRVRRRTYLVPVEKSPCKPRLIMNSKREANMSKKWITSKKKCVLY